MPIKQLKSKACGPDYNPNEIFINGGNEIIIKTCIQLLMRYLELKQSLMNGRMQRLLVFTKEKVIEKKWKIK